MHNKTKTNTEPPQPMGNTMDRQQNGQQPKPQGGLNALKSLKNYLHAKLGQCVT